MNRLWKLLKKEEAEDVQRRQHQAILMSTATHQVERMEEDKASQWGGSSKGWKYILREHEMMDQRLKSLYFTELCRSNGDTFRRRFRMSPLLFDKMKRSVANHDPYYVKNMDTTCRLGLSTEQKFTCAMRMLAYGLPANLIDEFLNIAESTAFKVLDHFTRVIWAIYRKDYICTPTKVDLKRLTNKVAERGFLSILGSLDYPLNDLNVLGMSPLFDEVCRGEAPQVDFKVANSMYHQGYYLMDDIYPNWATLVKAIKNPTTQKIRHFTRMQEAFIKDVDRAFGIVQARFAIVRV